jgi:YidC/Oxa1 family membrane protein insertase
MNIRKIYVGLIVLLSMGLFYEWSSDGKLAEQSAHLELAMVENAKPSVSDDGEYVYIENDLLKIKIAIKTGSIVESRLKKYGVENVDGSLGSRVLGSDSKGLFKYYFKSGFTGQKTKPSYVLNSFDDRYVLLEDQDLGITKEISFLPDTYEVSIKDSSINGETGKAFAAFYRTDGISLDMKTAVSQGGMMNNSSYQGVALSTDADPYETTRLRSLDKPISVLSRSGWVSFIEKYFFAALIGSNDYVYNYFAEPAESGVYRMGYKVEKSETENFVYSHDHRVFIGPKIRKELALRADNLELAIDMGWFWFISQPMVWVLDKINGFVGNWGLSIVLFTILLKILLWPITAKGFASMAGMRKVAGPMKEIQERYKDDRQKLSQEMMALYKKEGANPLGGCLPMLAQVPFFIGFFFALREMVELRHASLGLWIGDLSVPDPLFILPIVFGLIMVLTQKLNPAPPVQDPTQAQVMKYMPVMFSFMFIIFPAGLCLYSVVNSGVSLIQQKVIYKRLGASANVVSK